MNNTNIRQSYAQLSCSIVNNLFGLYIFIDLLSGYFHLNNYSISISIPFKMVLFILMLVVIAYDGKTVVCIWNLFLHAFFCLFHIFDISEDFSLAVNNLYKLNFSIAMFVYFRYYFSVYYSEKMYKIARINEIMFFVNMVLATLGLGFSTYGGKGVGLKGFFYAGNELGALVFCLCVYSYIKHNYKIWPIMLYSGVALLIGTKTPIFAIWTFYFISSLLGNNWRSRAGLLVIGVVALIVYFNRSVFLDLDVVQYHLNNLKGHHRSNDSLINGMLSGRIDYFSDLWYKIREEYSITNIFLGYGSPEKYAEIDPVDTFYSYGILALIVQLCFYVILILKSRKNNVLLSFNIIYFILAFTAGHVWFNTTSILFFCLINSLDFNCIRHKSFIEKQIRIKERLKI